MLTPEQAEAHGLVWCDLCCAWRTHLDERTGWCEPCTIKRHTDAQALTDREEAEELEREEAEVARLLAVIEAEQERDRLAAVRRQNKVKKDRERLRELYGANPRKGRAQ